MLEVDLSVTTHGCRAWKRDGWSKGKAKKEGKSRKRREYVVEQQATTVFQLRGTSADAGGGAAVGSGSYV